MQSKRIDATLWDCGCLNWTEDDKFIYLPCEQSDCRVEPIVKEVCREQGISMIKVKIHEEFITIPKE